MKIEEYGNEVYGIKGNSHCLECENADCEYCTVWQKEVENEKSIFIRNCFIIDQ